MKWHGLAGNALDHFGNLFCFISSTQIHEEQTADRAGWVYFVKHRVYNYNKPVQLHSMTEKCLLTLRRKKSPKKIKYYYCDHIIWRRNPKLTLALFYVSMIGIGRVGEAKLRGPLCIKAKTGGSLRFHQILWMKEPTWQRDLKSFPNLTQAAKLNQTWIAVYLFCLVITFPQNHQRIKWLLN